MNWFKAYGDKLFTFITLASAALQGVDGLSMAVTQGLLIVGILATAAHQSFFGNSPQSGQGLGK